SVDAQRGTVEIRLRVPSPPAFVRPDMTVSVEMVVGQREGVLVVPAEAVRGADGARPFALVLRGGRAEQVSVKLGLRGIGVAEIVEGANEGDMLILPNADAVAGDRVRAKPERVTSKAAPPPGTKRPGTTPVPGTN
ncbi:MAG: efflux RND transporter periplasmic adaptor subunit, partial [Burkholderiales bacterium]